MNREPSPTPLIALGTGDAEVRAALTQIAADKEQEIVLLDGLLDRIDGGIDYLIIKTDHSMYRLTPKEEATVLTALRTERARQEQDAAELRATLAGAPQEGSPDAAL